MPGKTSENNISLYLVHGTAAGLENKRIKNIQSLEPRLQRLRVIAPSGRQPSSSTDIVRSYKNPIGLLRKLGLRNLAIRIEALLYFPSRKILYVAAVRKRLFSEIANDLRNGVRPVLITCVPPHDLLVLGIWLKKRIPELRWIVDWQDLWSFDDNYFQRVPRMYRNRLRRTEAQALRTADLHVTTNDRAGAVLGNHYEVPTARVFTILHPYDDDDLGAVRTVVRKLRPRTDETIRICFLGTLFKPPRVPGHEVVEAFVEANRLGRKVELHVIGDTRAERSHTAVAGSDGVLFFHPRALHEESLRQAAQYDFLLVVLADLPNSRAVLSIKLPAYLAVGRPILAVVPEESAVADLVASLGGGVIVPPGPNLGRRIYQGIQAWSEDIRIKGGMSALPSAMHAPVLAERWWQAVSKEGDLAASATRLENTGSAGRFTWML
jgi:hypothetical protein